MKSNKKKQKTKTIRVACGNAMDYPFMQKIKGDLISIRGLKDFEFVVHKRIIYSGFTISEVGSGHACGNGSSKELAVKNFKINLKKYGKDRFPKLIKKRIAENKKRGF